MKQVEKAPDWKENIAFAKGAELLSDPYFRSLVNKINDEYLYWNKVKYQQSKKKVSARALWSAVKLSRSVKSREIQFGKYSFTYNLTDTILKELHEFDSHSGRNSEAEAGIPENDKKRYLVSSIMEEAIASSQIEGAITTRKHAKEMLRKNSKPTNKSEQMIVNNYLTIKRILEFQNEPITADKLFEIHRLITNQTLDDSADEGRYRDNNDINVIDAIDGEIVHMPPGFKTVPKLMTELIYFFNNDDPAQFIHPIIKGCIVHFMIGYIHPFVDGNGRTARALFYWYMLKKGYWLTEYLSVSRLIIKSKTQYAQAYIYSETDDNDLTYFIKYKLKTLKQAFESLTNYVQRQLHEKKQTTDLKKIKGINERQALVLNWMQEDADLLLSVKEIETRFNISNQTARTDLEELVRQGYLDMIEFNKKTKGFCRGSKFEEKLKKSLQKTTGAK
ncbi:MAG TPA: Fic family protein [Bacteroidia bacterium]|jgi:Fic family protein|nr:Fic family protein [Bacteroidia bacterium]